LTYLLCQYLSIISLIKGFPSNFGNSMSRNRSTTLGPWSYGSSVRHDLHRPQSRS
jgi:hypothetical protein